MGSTLAYGIFIHSFVVNLDSLILCSTLVIFFIVIRYALNIGYNITNKVRQRQLEPQIESPHRDPFNDLGEGAGM